MAAGIVETYVKYAASFGTALMAVVPIGAITLFVVTAMPFVREALITKADLTLAVLLATVVGVLWFRFCLGLGTAAKPTWIILPSILMAIPPLVAGWWLGLPGVRLGRVALLLFAMGLAGHYLCCLSGRRRAGVASTLGAAIVSAWALITLGQMAARSLSFNHWEAIAIWVSGMLTLGFLPFARMKGQNESPTAPAAVPAFPAGAMGICRWRQRSRARPRALACAARVPRPCRE